MPNKQYLSPEERKTLKKEIFASLHCALPGTVVSFDASSQTAVIQPAVKVGSMTFPLLADVPVFMPVTFEVNPGDACLVVFADIDIDAFLETGEASVPGRHGGMRCQTVLRLWDSERGSRRLISRILF